MALDDLLKHIESEAQKEIEKIKSDSEKQLAAINEKFVSEKKLLHDSYEKKLDEEKKKELSNAVTSARIKARIELLDAKRKILDDFFLKLWDKILSADKESKKKIYEKLLNGIDGRKKRCGTVGRS